MPNANTLTIHHIFKEQRILLDRFSAVEKENGLCRYDRVPLDLDTKRSQEGLRLLAWRITEEVGEALHALYLNQHESFREEVADVFHFIVELMILVDVTPTEANHLLIERGYPSRVMINQDSDRCWMDLIVELALALNHLKNRPWSKKEKPLEAPELFRRAVSRVFVRFITACGRSGIDYYQLFGSYIKKNEINHGRIEEESPI